jgi:Uma2 family endonuclease
MSTVARDIPVQTSYPSTDGKPMAESPIHMRVMMDAIETLIAWFNDAWVYVWGNLFVYYIQNDPRKNVAPDVMVVKGVPRDKPRKTFKIWEEGKGPDWILEATSQTTRHQDEVEKFQLYQDVLKVQEYYLFDPYMDYLDPPLKGYRLVNGKYEPIAPVEGRIPSEVLGLHLEPHLGDLRFYDPRTGRHLLAPREEVERLRQENDALRQQLPKQP